MFKRLLFGNEEEKLAFKTSTSSGIARLYAAASQPIDPPPREAAYWRSFTTSFDTASDVFGIFSVSDVRRALSGASETGRKNVKTLVEVCVAHLESLRDDVDFCPEPGGSSSSSGGGHAAGTTGPARWGTAAAMGAARLAGGAGLSVKAGEGRERDRVKEALNCLRILTRVLPVVMEGDHDASCNVEAQGGADPSASLATDDFERDLLWTRRANTTQAEAHVSGGESEDVEDSQQFVIDDDIEDEEESKQRKGQNGDPLSDGPTQQERNARRSPLEEEEVEEGAEGVLPPSLGERLLTLVIDLLFYSGFTIPWTDEQLSQASETAAAPRIQYAIWQKGVGSSVDLVNTTRQHEAHRVEVLRLLLVLLSKSIYIPAHLQATTENPALKLAATGLDRSVVLPLLCSLLNVGLRADDQGWLSNLANLPAGFVKERGAASPEETRLNLVSLSLQTLNVILGFDSIKPEDLTGDKEVDQEAIRPRLGTNASSQSISSAPRPFLSGAREGSSSAMNLFRFYLTKLHRHADFLTLSDGIFSILASRGTGGLSSLSGVRNLAGGSTTISDPSGPHVSEALMLLWRLLIHNTKFRTFLLDDGTRSPALLSHLLYHALANKDSLPKQGLVRLCAFMLQDVSAERAFGIHISKAGSGARAHIHNGHKWGVAQGGGSSLSSGGTGAATFGGGGGVAGAAGVGGGPSQASTGADILIQATYSLIATTRGTLASLYAPLVISLGNTAPFWRKLSILSSNRLVALLSSFSASSFLLSDDGNPRILFYLLESINAVLHHGYAHNPNFIYALVRGAHPSVQRLATFTLRKGIADIRRTRKRAGMYAPSPQPTSSTSLGPRESSPVASRSGDSRSDETEENGQRTTTPSADQKEPVGGGPALSDDSGVPDEESVVEQSEKAKGKMRRRSNGGITSPAPQEASKLLGEQAEDEEDVLVAGFNEEELQEAARTVGRNGFVPTTGWVQSWQVGLPLDSLQIALTELLPKVEELCTTGALSSKSDADERILAFLREQTLVGVLPPSPPIHTRPFRWTTQAHVWLLSFLWGHIYVMGLLPYGIWAGSNARLFQVRPLPSASSNNGSSWNGTYASGALAEQQASLVSAFQQVLGWGGSSPSVQAPRSTAPTSP